MGAQGKSLLNITKIFWEEGTCYVLSNWSCGTGFVLWALADGPYCLTENLDRSSPWPGRSLAWVDKVVCRILGTWRQGLPSSLVALRAIFSLRHLASGAWSRAFQVPFFPGKLWGMLWGHRGSSSPLSPSWGMQYHIWWRKLSANPELPRYGKTGMSTARSHKHTC